MIGPKDIRVDPISAKDANKFVKNTHYSGTYVRNSQLHFGCFLNGRLGGVLSFGHSMAKSKTMGLVKDTGWNGFIELNRMAFSDLLPRNSESRCISVCLRIIKKKYPHIKWVVSYADAQQCGDGTIYRASGFYLTGFSSGAMWLLPESLRKINGSPVAHTVKVRSKCSLLSKHILNKTKGKNLTTKGLVQKFGGAVLTGYNIRYIYFLDKTYKVKLTVPILPYSKIKEMGASMYLGVSSVISSTSGDQPLRGGAIPTDTLQKQPQ